MDIKTEHIRAVMTILCDLLAYTGRVSTLKPANVTKWTSDENVSNTKRSTEPLKGP